MAKKKNALACPICQTRLLDGCGQCSGVIITCPHCGASVLADIDESGRMRLSVEPVGSINVPTAMPKRITAN